MFAGEFPCKLDVKGLFAMPASLREYFALPGNPEVKKALLSNEASPIHYPDGRQPLPGDAEIARYPFGAQSEADVEVTPVDSMFE